MNDIYIDFHNSVVSFGLIYRTAGKYEFLIDLLRCDTFFYFIWTTRDLYPRR